MKEIASILSGFRILGVEGKPAALATVVRVSGSSYRRPGARMLIAGDGRTLGGVSGGCLERDVARRARIVLETGMSEVRRYDTTDDFGEGTALGCAGLIDILIEPLSADRPGPIPALQRVLAERRPEALATLLPCSPGQRTPGPQQVMDVDSPQVRAALQQVAESGVGGIRLIDGVEFFFEWIRPPQSLVLFGGGPDVVPVVQIARTLGWHVTVVASHAVTGFRERFAAADLLAMGTDEDPLGGVALEAHAAVVLMTHHYPRDLLLLPRLLSQSLVYFGILGPRRRAERLVLECPNVPPDAMSRLHAPVGMDLGGQTPETIALAILAEIQAVLSSRPCMSLRDRAGPIYPGDAAFPQTPYSPNSCPMSA